MRVMRVSNECPVCTFSSAGVMEHRHYIGKRLRDNQAEVSVLLLFVGLLLVPGQPHHAGTKLFRGI